MVSTDSPAVKTVPMMAPKRKGEPLETLKGFKDVLPIDAPYWKYVNEKIEKLVDDYGFKMIETPVLESISLFKRSIGRHTDIIEKEMFEFEDKSGEMVSLRPEGTAGIARSFINHGMHNLPQPLKLYYKGPMFRYENPQSGRLRQFNQVGFEILGAQGPAADAQLILIAQNLLKDLGINFSLQINSIGCANDREAFKNALVEYYKPFKKQLCEDCKIRLAKNPMRLLDCKEEECIKLKQNAPQTIDYLDEECKKHFMQVLEFLDELAIPYNLNPFLVRGLDYYTRTVFEFWPIGEIKSQSALLSGGRYDTLIEELGGQPTPAVGFAAGVERLIIRIKEEGVVIAPAERPEIFIAQLGIEAKKKAMALFEDLRKEGFKIAENFAKDSLKQQLESANKLRARITLIIGQKELQEKTILLRDMDAGVQEIVDQKKIFQELRKRLEVASVIDREQAPAEQA